MASTTITFMMRVCKFSLMKNSCTSTKMICSTHEMTVTLLFVTAHLTHQNDRKPHTPIRNAQLNNQTNPLIGWGLASSYWKNSLFIE